jgi:hypothetical protein
MKRLITALALIAIAAVNSGCTNSSRSGSAGESSADGGSIASSKTYTTNGDGTVNDKTTGLTWMRCPAGQSGDDCSTGNATKYTWQDAIDYCDKLNFADYDDWRLPEVHELFSIVDYTKFNPAFDVTTFPATPIYYFWSSSSHSYDTNEAWYVYLYTGLVIRNNKTYRFDVRCVRGGPLVIGSFVSSVVSGERLVQDKASGLMWQGCPAGQSGESCDQGSAAEYSWQDASDYCDNLTWADYSDWRLPNINELISIADFTKNDPAIDGTAFPVTPSDSFGSSSSYVYKTRLAWQIDFDYSDMDFGDKTYGSDIRCVRGGP